MRLPKKQMPPARGAFTKTKNINMLAFHSSAFEELIQPFAVVILLAIGGRA